MENNFKHINYSHAFQPIIDIESATIVSYEVLLRGKSNEPPFKVFEQIKSEQIALFDQKSREKALLLASKLNLKAALNLNFTPASILYENGKYVKDTIIKAQEYGISPQQLVIEITESEVVHNIALFAKILNNLRKEEISIAIDDFGAGYAGLNLLVEIQPDLLKLDMQLIRDIHKHGPRQSIVKAICNVCFDLGIDVLAEGVESKEEFNFLKNIDISLYQGYFFAKPAFEIFPKVDFDKYLN